MNRNRLRKPSDAAWTRRQFMGVGAAAGTAAAVDLSALETVASSDAAHAAVDAEPALTEAMYRDNIYTRLLGVRPHLPAHEHISRLSGSRMPPEVTRAMAEANEFFVDMNDLTKAAGAHIAKALGAEAACVTSGAFSGMMLAAAACLTGTDQEKVEALTAGDVAQARMPDAEDSPLRLRPRLPRRGHDHRRGGDARAVHERDQRQDGDDLRVDRRRASGRIRSAHAEVPRARTRARGHAARRAHRDRKEGRSARADRPGVGHTAHGEPDEVHQDGRRSRRLERRQGAARSAVGRFPGGAPRSHRGRRVERLSERQHRPRHEGRQGRDRRTDRRARSIPEARLSRGHRDVGRQSPLHRRTAARHSRTHSRVRHQHRGLRRCRPELGSECHCP